MVRYERINRVTANSLEITLKKHCLFSQLGPKAAGFTEVSEADEAIFEQIAMSKIYPHAVNFHQNPDVTTVT